MKPKKPSLLLPCLFALPFLVAGLLAVLWLAPRAADYVAAALKLAVIP